MSNKPRNPTYFPRMKVRGARRRRIAPIQRLTGSYLRLKSEVAKATEAMKQFAQVVNNGR